MKQKLLLIILPMLLLTATLQAQTKVWDFGATQLDPGTYTNMLDVASINAALASNSGTINPGTTGNTINTPGVDFGGGVQYLTAGTNDRLRTTTAGITSYDTNISGDGTYVGRIYVNSSAKSDRYLQLELTAGDQITLVVKTDAGGTFNFEFIANPSLQHETVVNDGSQVEINFTASQTGSYKIYDTVGKPSYYRIYLQSVLGINDVSPVSSNIKAVNNRIYVSNVKTSTEVNIYSITGALVKSFKTNTDIDFSFRTGLYIATVKTEEGQKAVKLLTY